MCQKGRWWNECRDSLTNSFCTQYLTRCSRMNRLDHHQTDKSEEEAFLEYVRILFTDMAVLQSFLGEIDTGFIVCHDWDRLGEQVQASNIAAFVSPNEEVADMVSAALVDSVRKIPHGDHHAGIDALTFDGAERLVSRLQGKLDSFEALYCGPKRAV